MQIKKSVVYYFNGNIRYEKWHKEGDEYYWHRENGPAFISYYDTGEKRHEAWWIDSKRHKIDGPARIWYNPDGTIGEAYYINDIELSKEEWEDHPLVQEWLIKEAMKEALECF